MFYAKDFKGFQRISRISRISAKMQNISLKLSLLML